MAKEDWIWMPHAGHFVQRDQCQFRMCTYVKGYIVSTIGELLTKEDDSVFEEIGSNRTYETMVFKARMRPGSPSCCPYYITGPELEVRGYNTAIDAYQGHLELCEKWDQLLKEGRTCQK